MKVYVIQRKFDNKCWDGWSTLSHSWDFSSGYGSANNYISPTCWEDLDKSDRTNIKCIAEVNSSTTGANSTFVGFCRQVVGNIIAIARRPGGCIGGDGIIGVGRVGLGCRV